MLLLTSKCGYSCGIHAMIGHNDNYAKIAATVFRREVTFRTAYGRSFVLSVIVVTHAD